MKFAYLVEPPFNYVDASGRVTGCDVELARYIFQQLGTDTFDPVETAFADLLPGLGNNRWRMTTGLFATDERRKTAHFSRPIWALPDGLLVRSGNPLQLCGYQSVAEHKHARLAVMKWSGKFGQRAKMYPTLLNGYENDEATEFFRQV